MSSKSLRYADVAVAIPHSRPFTYLVPDEMGKINIGTRVRVSLGKRQAVGYIVGFPAQCEFPVKPLLEAMDREAVLDEDLLEFSKWISNYYNCGWGEAIRAALPPGMDGKQQRMVWLNAYNIEAGPSDSIIELIREKGAVSFEYLVKKAGPGAEAIINDYCRKNILISELVWQKAKVGVKMERWLAGCNIIPSGEPRLSQGHLEFLNILNRQGKIPSNLLKNKKYAAGKLVNLGLAKWEWREVIRQPAEMMWNEPDRRIELNQDQQQILSSISSDIKSRAYSVNLISGVTSSGKTEIYLRAAEEALSLGRGVIILVPEIGMTSQMLYRVRSRLGRVAVWHSEMGSGERYDAWRSVKQGSHQVVVGTRSAVFAPLKNLGLIVIDEEHDGSYKQSDMAPLYNARDAAIVRAKMKNACVIMGSATPSVESYHKALTGKFKLFKLAKRVGDARLPKAEVVDLKKLPKSDQLISPLLKEEIGKCLAGGRQAMILLNRRGFSPYVQCGRCGTLIVCPNCAVSLTYHRTTENMVCHYCGYVKKLPEVCSDCGSLMLSPRGIAIQQLEQELKNIFYNFRIIRMDADTTSRRGGHHRILKDFQSGQAQILLGTQMIAKGHHFPNVSLVGIVNLDDILGLPDFRASERAFQLLVQMSGRAGRGEHSGKVIIQTRVPDNPVIKWGRENDYYAFADSELKTRKECHYPPFTFLAMLTLSASRQTDLEKISAEIYEKIKKNCARVEAMGPSPAPIEKVKGRYRWQIMIKSNTPGDMKKAITNLSVLKQKDFKLIIDIDPINML